MVPVYDSNEKETHCGEDTGILKDRTGDVTFLQYNQQDAPVSLIIYSCKTLHMFRAVFPSIIGSSKLHIRQQAYVKQQVAAAV